MTATTNFNPGQGGQFSAMVVRAMAPPVSRFPGKTNDWVCVVFDMGAGPMQVRTLEKLDKDRWLVPGSTVSVTVDPNEKHLLIHPFALDWDSVKPINERVAAQDATLVDTVASRQAAQKARETSNKTFSDPYYEGPLMLTDAVGASITPFEDVMAQAKTAAAPGGMVRAVVVVAALRHKIKLENNRTGQGTLESDHFPPQRYFEDGSRKGNPAVVSVYIPDRSPYAVYLDSFPYPQGKDWHSYLPAVVSPDKPSDIKILWDEVRVTPDAPEGNVVNMQQGSMPAPQPGITVIGPAAAATVQGPAPEGITIPQIAEQMKTMSEVDRASTLNQLRSVFATLDPETRQRQVDALKEAGIEI